MDTGSAEQRDSSSHSEDVPLGMPESTEELNTENLDAEEWDDEEFHDTKESELPPCVRANIEKYNRVKLASNRAASSREEDKAAPEKKPSARKPLYPGSVSTRKYLRTAFEDGQSQVPPWSQGAKPTKKKKVSKATQAPSSLKPPGACPSIPLLPATPHPLPFPHALHSSTPSSADLSVDPNRQPLDPQAHRDGPSDDCRA